MSVMQDTSASLWQMIFASLSVILLPEGLAVLIFSDIGFASEVATVAASSQSDLAGNSLAILCAIFLAFAFVVDVQVRPTHIKIPIAFTSACLFLATSVFKYISYPWLGGLVCFGFAVALIAYLRVSHFAAADIRGQDFFNAVSMSFVLAAFLLTAGWIGWQSFSNSTWSDSTKIRLAESNAAVYRYVYDNDSWDFDTDCNATAQVNVTADEAAAISTACQKSQTVWFLQWAAPCALGICNALAAAICRVFSQAARDLEPQQEQSDLQHVKKVLKLCTTLIIFMLGLMYGAQYVSGADVAVSSGLLALGAMSTSTILAFMFLEFGFERLTQCALQDGLAKNLISILKSDWMKAVAVGGLNVFIPIMALLDRIRQKIRRCTGRLRPDDKDVFTKEGRRIVTEMSAWPWCDIFLKVDLLGELFVLLLLGMKFTYVFFSWLNETLAAMQLTFGVLALLVFLVALVMFLCPLVPGSAVYLFAGVVFGAQSQLNEDVGFALGVVTGSAVSSAAKMIACTMQYSMGYAMSRSVRVQQFVGVDKVPTRAMEHILKQKGLKIDKVAILVAGPDWPTSVLCGILGLQIPQMLLGTVPVILVSIVPQVLVGALLTLEEGSSGIMGMVSSFVTLAAAVVQAVAMFFFSYRIMKVVEDDGEELQKFRAEHREVAELTSREAAYVNALRETCIWDRMKFGQRGLVSLSATCLLIAGFVLAADYSSTDKFCFNSFSITSEIDMPVAAGGLNGNALNLILPAGWVALGVAAAGFVLHIAVGKWLSLDARRLLQQHSTSEQPQASMLGKWYSFFKDHSSKDTE